MSPTPLQTDKCCLTFFPKAPLPHLSDAPPVEALSLCIAQSAAEKRGAHEERLNTHRET